MQEKMHFTRMDQGTDEDFQILKRVHENTLKELPDRLIAMLHDLSGDQAYNLNRKDHSLQAATRALRTVNGQPIRASYEQSTALEWGNSDFANPAKGFQSFQDCHMPGRYHAKTSRGSQEVPLTPVKIANIEDDTFAPTTNSLLAADRTLTERERFSRHSLHGLNIFLNEMFQQFPLLLGLRQIDYMLPGKVEPALITGQNSILHMASQETAGVEITRLEAAPDGLTGVPLPTENAYVNRTQFQPHYRQITQGSQVQIYEELVTDSAGELTTSFLRRVNVVKDNRLRPRGFDPKVFAADPSPYIQQLGELVGGVADDPYYSHPALTGADEI